ncbi:hypothetical protein D8674_025786 [Pyrus ussuriensis x Pyrus communis]|uniref:Reverse transcriptase Ty1/copia-type domain-containing protein n=1 Tax=Pyrus ussuriensis x Pyrus communis TaxID=2448454 RepID=A0A5N5I9V9_9ROSA|nr:hypothetical protein D8674_025786 [Pyrus ussuriensis x Pyrus communis]
MDVITTYLYGELDTDIYMKVTEGLKLPEMTNKPRGMLSIKLRRSLYGLKQSRRMWYNRLNEYLIKEGYINNVICPCVFIKKSDFGFAIVIVYVNDMNLKYPFCPKEDDELVLGQEVLYLSAIGVLLYLAQCTRPNIAFSVNLLARYNYTSTIRHWKGIKDVLRYLHGITNMGNISLHNTISTIQVKLYSFSFAMVFSHWIFPSKVLMRQLMLICGHLREKKTVLELTRLLVEKDYSWVESKKPKKHKTISLVSSQKHIAAICGDGRETKKSTIYNYTPLLIATRTGILPLVEKISDVHPQAIEAHDICSQQNILHMSIKHRQLQIFRLVKRSRAITSRLTSRIDRDGTTILHRAADMTNYSPDTQRVSDSGLNYILSHIFLIQRVEKITPPHYIMHRNNKGLTAEELFNKEHEKLLLSAQTWIKDITV